MGEWKEKPLSDLAILYNDSWKVGDEECPYIALEHIEESKLRLNGIGHSDIVTSNKYRFNEKNFLFGKLRPYFRKVVRPQFSGICSTDIWVVGTCGETDLSFLFYLFANREFVNLAYSGSSGTKMPRADWKFMKDTIWFIPIDVNEQKAIASVLSSLDDKIDLLHRQNKTLEAMAETLFRQWFVEEAQEDWEIVKLDSLINISSGKGLKKEHLSENGAYPVLGANGVIGRTNEFLFNESLLFTGRVGTLGNIFRVENEKVWLSDNTLVIKPKNYFNFIYFVLKTAKLEEYNVGSTQPLIRQSDIKEIEISLPSENKLHEFEKESDLLLNKIRQNKSQIRTLEKLRDTLLPKLMSGDVRVKT